MADYITDHEQKFSRSKKQSENGNIPIVLDFQNLIITKKTNYGGGGVLI